MKRVLSYFRLIRPNQWVKNVFVFVPLIFSKNLFDFHLFAGSLLTFASFCFAASSVYIVNDIADRELDKLHPIKKDRPIAAGAVTVVEGWSLAVLLLIISFAVIKIGSVRFTVIIPIAAYIILNLLYSFALKRIVLIDLFVIAAGFILRIIAGGYAIDVKISSWLIMTTLFISIFLGVAKRRGEFVHLSQSKDESSRKVLINYDLSLIDQILSISSASVIITYALYTVSERTVMAFKTEALIFTTIFVVYGIFRYLYLIHKMGLGESPINALFTDKPMVINIIFYVASAIAIIYKQELIRVISKYVPFP
ncbi:MAG: decaprenyl-phosphate phosphoribosyltransferase [Candidatus Kryptoniota bacterium]